MATVSLAVIGHFGEQVNTGAFYSAVSSRRGDKPRFVSASSGQSRVHISVPPGEYTFEARLPSGERFCEHLALGDENRELLFRRQRPERSTELGAATIGPVMLQELVGLTRYDEGYREMVRLHERGRRSESHFRGPIEWHRSGGGPHPTMTEPGFDGSLIEMPDWGEPFLPYVATYQGDPAFFEISQWHGRDRWEPFRATSLARIPFPLRNAEFSPRVKWGIGVRAEGPHEAGSEGLRLLPQIILHDNAVFSVLSFLESGDFEATRFLSQSLPDICEEYLREKVQNPVLAAAGAYVILRLREFDRLHHWARNLANWFPWLPDGAVIFAWQCLLQRGDREQALKYLRVAACRGLPFFTEGVRLLYAGLRMLADSEDVDLRWIRDVANQTSPESIFAVYTPHESGCDDASLRFLSSLFRSPSHEEIYQLDGLDWY